MELGSLMTLIILVSSSSSSTSATEKTSSRRRTYIVHVEAPEDHQLSLHQSLDSYYHSFLQTTSNIEEDRPKILHAYRNVLSGFAAELTPEEVKSMEAAKPGLILRARPEKVLPLHTTRSPAFMGLRQNVGLWRDSNYGKGTIIGILDTGIYPQHPSFDDEGVPPPPKRWRGKCELEGVRCNNKIIGARAFGPEHRSPSDEIGHGTYTASVAAGNFVGNASLFGNVASGTASGTAPWAHLAIYKVCDSVCSESLVLAAIDVAIEDGVDVLSLSFGEQRDKFFEDVVAIGAFRAVQRGISVICSAGNGGPSSSSLINTAPWILTVGASTIDRRLRATARLRGKGQKQLRLNGESAFQPTRGLEPSEPVVPVVYAGALDAGDPNVSYCTEALARFKNDIRGKIVVCELGLVSGIEKGEAIRKNGGSGMVLLNNEEYANTIFAEPHVLPATELSYSDGLRLKRFINSTENPTAKIRFGGTLIGGGDRPAPPSVAAFSSRGPNNASPGILKPDVLGPGHNILGAWPASLGINPQVKSTFNILSGTSVSCPHLSGVAALLKTAHPDWSPAAIKSAIMTTADAADLTGGPIEDERLVRAGLFDTGSGHVSPSRARDPGLVYDAGPDDYVRYLCGLNYTDREVGLIVGGREKANCSERGRIPEAQLNYPSFALSFEGRNGNNVQTYTRVVTNVGEAESRYEVEIARPGGVEVRVEPTVLEFTEVNQRLEYRVTFRRVGPASDGGDEVVGVREGYLKWSFGKYSVRSPIAVILK